MIDFFMLPTLRVLIGAPVNPKVLPSILILTWMWHIPRTKCKQVIQEEWEKLGINRMCSRKHLQGEPSEKDTLKHVFLKAYLVLVDIKMPSARILSKLLIFGINTQQISNTLTEMIKWNYTSEFEETKNLPSDTLCSQLSKSLQIRAGLSRVPRGFFMLCSKLLR